MDDYMTANQKWWNEAAQVHAQGEGYQMKEFKEGMAIFDALLSAGLTIDFFHEHPFCVWECLPDMEKGEDRLIRFKDPKKREIIPLMSSLKATKR